MRSSGRRILAVAILAAAWGSPCFGDDPITFNRHIRPILSNNCFLCHGPDKNERKAGLRLDVREEAIAGNGGVRAIIPGDSANSELIRRVESHDPGEVMPPSESERHVSAAEIALLKKWIDAGAEYEPHWAYLPPVSHPVPNTADAGWSRNPIDAFVYRRLAMNGLQPSPEAGPQTLLRRISYDLTGLPPSPEDVAAFRTDSSPDAYDALVDRLLASPHYGERMAVHWLDMVRYADTNGFHGDEHRSIYPYRDYVIDAFNANKPYDRFTIEQLAGDLLPDASQETRVASAYNRLNQLTAEGGAQPKEYEAKYAADRVRTTASVWLGATMGCAECHDHKFDPLTMKDFYSFAAFFADIDERAVYTAGGIWEPVLYLPTAEQQPRYDELTSRKEKLESILATQTPELDAAMSEWEESVRAAIAAERDWSRPAPSAAVSKNGAKLAVRGDGSVFASGPEPASDVYTVHVPLELDTVTAILLDTPTHKTYGRGSDGNVNFVLSEFEVAISHGDGEPLPVPLASVSADYEQEGFIAAYTIDGDLATGWAVDGHLNAADHRAMFVPAEPIPAGAGSVLTITMHFASEAPAHAIGWFALGVTNLTNPAMPPLTGTPAEMLALVKMPAANRTGKDTATLQAYYRSIAPALDATRTELAGVSESLSDFLGQVPYTLVTQATQPREVRILPRGNFLDESGDVVQPAIPAVFGTLDVEGRASRLDLAQWLASRDNPDAARVFVNHLWKLFFGTGLSKVLDDVGSQGEWPSHPDLLDWLAVEFMDSGWDVKHVVRLIVTSATYRQTSEIAGPELREADPFNRLLARQSSVRYTAEFIRDKALAVAGLLSDDVGGRSVFPYQPDGYWDNCNTFRGPLIYTTDTGDQQYRRGLYTYWKRSFLHPSMLAFDAPTREECTAQRPISNTPLQALVLLNDPSYVEAARVLAERTIQEGGTGLSDRIDWLFDRVLSRQPTERERQLLMDLFHDHLARYQANPNQATALVSNGQRPAPEDIDPVRLAAWTSVTRVLLNLHETITRA